MKRFLLILLSVLFLAPTLVACLPKAEPDPYEGKLLLAKDGVSDYRIVLPENASETLRATAGEFQKYFKDITSVTLHVVDDTTEATGHEIVLHETKRDEGETKINRIYLGKEGFCIRSVGENLFISGGGERGTLYGVYAFFEEYLGVRYFAEGQEFVPNMSVVAIDSITTDHIEKPGFEFRLQSHQSASSYNEKLHLNGAWSGDKQPIAGGIEYTGPWYVHTFGSLLGWDSRKSYKNQPCLNDPGLYATMYNNACKYIEKNPNATVISISQNDSTYTESGECTCDKCTADKEKYGSSGAMLNFINRIANALKSKYPHIYVETLAYYYTQEPPKGGVVPYDNVIIRYCTAGGCMIHSLEEETGDSLYEQISIDSLENLKGWAEITENLYIWDYNIDFGCTLTTLPNFDRIYDNITLYYELGVDGIYMQGMRDAGEFDRLRGYLVSKLLWNPRMTREEFDAIRDDFLLGYYGPAGKDVQAYIDYLAEICDDKHPSMYYDASRVYPMNKNEDGTADRTHYNELKKIYDSALSQVETYEQEQRVRRSLLSLPYYDTLLLAMELDSTEVENIAALEDANRNLYEAMKRSGIEYMREGVKLPDIPNFRNTLLYWGWDGALLYSEATADAHNKRKEEAAKKEKEGQNDESIDVTDAFDEAEKDA